MMCNKNQIQSIVFVFAATILLQNEVFSNQTTQPSAQPVAQNEVQKELQNNPSSTVPPNKNSTDDKNIILEQKKELQNTSSVEPIDLDKERPLQAGSSAQNAPMEMEYTPATEEAVQRGLRYLAGTQNDDGSFGKGQYERHAGITSLCALAFMADGHVPGRGVYGDNVRRAF